MSSAFEWERTAHGLWLVGLALMLAAGSFTDYRRAVQPLSWRDALRDFTSSPWTRLGALLFSLGMALTAGSLPERALWGLLALYAGVTWWLAGVRHRTTDDGRQTRGHRRALGTLRTPFDWSIAILVLMAVVSIFVTPDISLTLPGVGALLLGIAAYYALVFWIGVGRPGRLAWAALTYAVLAGLVLTAYALLTLEAPGALPLTGGEANPNQTGGALAPVAPMQLALLPCLWSGGVVGSSSRFLWVGRALLLTAFALTLGALLLTQSRGAIAGFFLGVLLLLWLSGSRLRVGGLLLAVVAAVGLFYLAGAGVVPQITELFDPRTLGSRANIWANSVHAIEDFPFTGVGMNGFRRLMPLMYPTFVLPPSSAIGYAHNDFLQSALDLGLPGLVAYMSIWAIAFGLAVSMWRRRADPLQRTLTAGISAGLLAYFVFGIIDAVELGSGLKLTFWIVPALLVALTRQPD